MIRIAPTLVALLLAMAPAVLAAQPTTPPAEQTAEAIDHYFANPREPGTYRALAGRGDPDVGGWSEGYEPIPERQRRLLAAMLGSEAPVDGRYWYPQAGMCRTDYALSVAERRADRFGEDHPYVRQWLRVQRAVFAPCREIHQWESRRAERARRAAPASLPPAMTSDDAEIARLQRHDRAYQAAALLFYRRDPAAERAFQTIARTDSPHAAIARYMLAALPARDLEAFSYSNDAEARAQAARQAEVALAEARAILADPSLREAHPLAQGLIGFLGYHTGEARVRAAQVDSVLDALEAPIQRIAADEAAAERYSRAVADVRWLHGEFEDPAWWLNGAVPAEMTASRAMAEQARSRPLAAFLLFPQSPWERQAWAAVPSYRSTPWLLEEHSQQQAERETGKAWAVLRASFAESYDSAGWAELDALRDAALSRPTDQRLAALATLFYHRVRAAVMYPARNQYYEPLPEQNGFAEAMTRVESWPWKDSAHYRELVSDMLAFLVSEGRLADARTVRDRLNPRGDGFGTRIALLLLAEDQDRLAAEIAAAPDGGQNLINLLSGAELARLAEREDLPNDVRARFARTAWARLYALERPIPRTLDLLMRRLNPEITATWASRPGARTGDRRLLLDVLRSPGLNILITDHQRGAGASMGYGDDPGLTAIDTFEHSDNNWWCAWQPDRHRLTASSIMYQAFFAPDRRHDDLAVAGAAQALGPLLRESWLWRSQDPVEQSALATIPSAPQMLAERAIAWRNGGLFGGGVAGQDEALALAVRATRYGCQRQGGHGRWSRAAWTLLHHRFAGRPAAARTRWWFDCSHFTGGCDRQREEETTSWRRWTRGYWN